MVAIYFCKICRYGRLFEYGRLFGTQEYPLYIDLQLQHVVQAIA